MIRKTVLDDPVYSYRERFNTFQTFIELIETERERLTKSGKEDVNLP